MAEGKKSFIIYSNWKDLFESLEDKQCATLIRHIFRYVNDESPTLKDKSLIPVWLVIKPILQNDLKKWDNIKGKRAESGRLGGLAKQANARSAKQNKQSVANLAVNVNGNVNDNVIDNDVYMHELANNKDIHGMFIEGLYMRHRLKPKSLGVILPEFNNNLKVKEKVHKSIDEYKDHLGHWMNTQETNKKLDHHKR